MATQKPNPILDYAAQSAMASNANRQAQIDTSKILEEQQKAQNDAIISTRAAGTAKVAVINGEQAIAAATDAEKARIVEKFGTSYADQASQSNRWADEMRMTADKAYAARDKLNEAQSKDFMSDPLGFIQAQFTMSSTANEYNYYVDKHNMAKTNLAAITQASDSAVQATSRAAATTSTELAIAKATEAASLSEAQVAKMLSDSAGTRIQGVSIINDMSAKQLTMAYQLHTAQNSDKSLAMQEQSMREQSEMRKLALQQSRDTLDAKEAELDRIKYEMDAYNAGARRTGKMTFDSIQRFQAAYKSSQNTPEFMNTLSSGKLIVLNKGVTDGIAIADNAGEAAALYASGQVSTPVGQFLKQTYLDLKTNPTAAKDRVGFNAQVSEAAKQIAEKSLKKIDMSLPASNIYAAPPPSVVLQSKGLSTPFIDSTVRPMLEAEPNVKLPDAVLLSKAVDYAKANKANFNDAAESIALYYKKAVLQNNATNQYVENGLPKQEKYPAVIGGKIVDLTDPVAVRLAILREGWGASDATAAKLTGIYRPGN